MFVLMTFRASLLLISLNDTSPFKNKLKTSVASFTSFGYLVSGMSIEPIGSPLKSFVLKLGGFHTHMSFIGSFGYLMSGSGLANLLETVYASTAVSHMMSGKALARAVRGHFLVDSTLTALILSLVYGIPVPIFESYWVENGEKPIRNNDSTDDLHTRQIDIPHILFQGDSQVLSQT
jgi:hypothetical protein